MPKLGLGFQAMDSPETTKPTPTPTALDSPPIHDSPFSNFISNLSPIAHVRNPCVVRELSRLTSPPVVFKSPCAKQLSETNILKRSISLQSCRHVTSQCISADKKRSDGLAETEKPVSEYQRGSVSETQNSCHVALSSESPPSSSSGSVDGFLADPEADCVDSAKSDISAPIKSTHTPKSDQTGSNGSKKTILKFDGRSGTWIDAGRNMDALLFSSDNTKNDIQGDLGLYSKLGELEVVERQDGERAFGCPNINTSLPGGHAFTIRDSQISQMQVIENEHRSGHDSVCQRSAEPLDVIKFDAHSENDSGLSNGLVESTMLRGLKASETQRGIRRRCLQFEEVRLCAGGHSSTSSNLVNNVSSLKESNLVHMESRESEGSQMADAAQSSVALMRSQSSDKSPMASKRLGIGLHLNSVVSSASTESANVCVGVQGIESRMPKSSDYYSRPSIVAVKDSAVAQTWRSSSQKAFVSEDRDQSSPGKKRKRATSGDGADGCKRCSCKKTKCLKLYCDCFAAGVYCSGPCACQGCFNRPEYEDIVRETIEQIESRDPLAFAPKIVPLKPELLPSIVQEAVHGSTPSSARHKRGCNCKKSMCLKKYCECYQSNVGCSNGCRCKGCKNVYGRKEDPVAMDDVITRKVMVNENDKKVIEGTSIKSSKRVESDTSYLTPQTPLFQHSDPGKAAPKSRFVSERYLPSPGSDIPVLSSSDKPINKAPTSHRSSDQNEDYDRGRSGSTSSIRVFESGVSRCTEHSDTLMPKLLTSSRTRDCNNVAQNHQCSESDSLSTNSPLTPMMTRLCGTESRDGLVDMLGDNERTPMRLSSPNKKRVSSPQSHMYKLGSGSTGALKSGRHFILRSVPSFPPLTPCIESKGADKSQNTDPLQDDGIEN